MSELKAVVRELVRIYLNKRVPRSAAALAYYLTMTVFPLIVCVSSLLDRLGLGREALYNLLQGFLPSAALRTLLDYIGYVSLNQSRALFIGALFILVTSSASAFSTVTNTMADIQGRGYFSGFFGAIFSYIFSILFLLAIYASVFIVVTGRWFINFMNERFALDGKLDLWFWLRYVVLFLLLYVIVFAVYRLTTRREAHHPSIYIGVLLSTIALVAVSMVYSYMIDLSSNYSLVYGSLASIVVMMLWLYTCGSVLIIGNIYNYVRAKHRDGQTSKSSIKKE